MADALLDVGADLAAGAVDLVEVLLVLALGEIQLEEVEDRAVAIFIDLHAALLIESISRKMLNETNKSGFCTVKDLAPEEFIKGYADYLKKNNQLQIPAWADLVKTSKAKELAPFDSDWLYIRVAALARKIFLRPRLGVQLLRRLFGGSERRGTIRPKFCKAGGKVLRWSLQQLEKLKVIKKIKKEGDKHFDQHKINSRVMSHEGIKNLNRIATDLRKKKNAA